MMYRNTPLILSEPLSRHFGADVFLKLEALQPSGSFKNRGIGHLMKEKVKQGARQFVCSSGGNAGLAASFAASLLSVSIRVVVPSSTPAFMLEKIKQQGAIVIPHGLDWQEADQYARSLIQDDTTCYVPPFDDPLIWEGNQTMIDEVVASGIKPDAVVVSVGGGGLFCGVLQGLAAASWNQVPVYAVETEGSACFAAALKKGAVVSLERIDTVAKSLGARAVTKQALKLSKTHPVISKVVTDRACISACTRFANDERLLVEPACGAALSLVYDKDKDLKKLRRICVIVCGGAALSLEMMINWSKG